ncbi:DUF4091 domain-containing protein [Sesbania bispinosa]|nr:DUF4091 domain-containing protein [Sesbania bispinosa]
MVARAGWSGAEMGNNVVEEGLIGELLLGETSHEGGRWLVRRRERRTQNISSKLL